MDLAAATTRRSGHTGWAIGFLVVAVLWTSTGSALGQASNHITSVDPSAAAQGSTNLLVTFTLDTDAPPAPPAGVMPASVMIGSSSGAVVTHTSQHIVTAVFDISAGEPTGPKDATITFLPPEGGTLIFSMIDGFTVTAGEDMPPTISQQPQSQTVPPGSSVTFTVVAYGTEPLNYQWQRDAGDISGAIASSYAINPVAEADSGHYRCVVSNDIGMATSDEAVLTVAELPSGAYPIVDTGQGTCYGNSTEITCPADGQAFDGQDAQYTGNAPSYALSGDGLTVHDIHTGLRWQRSPDVDDDGDIDINDKLTWTEAQAYPAILNAESYGGYDDWRLPTIKELYSLIDFSGTDPSGCDDLSSCPDIVPFIDTDNFDFAYGDTSAGERIIDAQYASSTVYVSNADEELLFGVNFADGRIKGYGLLIFGSDKTFFVICVRGNTDYGVNNFVDNGDGTITDYATRLMWMQDDSSAGYTWEDALDHAENLSFAGHDDWRLPSIKELQSILDYARSPDTTVSAAIDPAFNVTSITNEEGQTDYPYYWAATTHANWTATSGASAAYVAFGRGLGYMDGEWRDVHGAGCQRSDPKQGDPADWPFGHGPQGDAVRIFNYVRAVRTVADHPVACPDGTIAECADMDRDGVRDDNCTWWACVGGACESTAIPFADMGGQFGACPPDDTADGNDRFQALNCFSNVDTQGNPGFPCETSPPHAYNVDAGGQFGSCLPDGVCDGNDAFAALNAFSGLTTCSCPPGPGPAYGLATPEIVDRTALVLRSTVERILRPGDLVEVDVYLGGAVRDLRGYQMHLGAVGGTHGRLELIGIMVDERDDHVFAKANDWRAFNVHTGQMVAGLDGAGVAAPAGAYLATFTYRFSKDAAGVFAIEVLHEDADATQRTFLFPTTVNGKIEIAGAAQAEIVVRSAHSRRGRSRVGGD